MNLLMDWLHERERKATRPLVLLDVGGVVAFEGEAEEEFLSIESDWRSWRIKHSVAAWVRKLAYHDAVELVWSTECEGETSTLNEALNLPIVPYITMKSASEDFLHARGYLENFKSKVMKMKSKIVWLDDEHDEVRQKRFREIPNLHCFPVRGKTGLTHTEMAEVERILQLS